ncbi:transposase [Rhodococcus opacus]|uniref:transposase n=1 Tax=Rhodococcus opacus TaxID=37919 RepID=UPI0012DB1800
MIGAVVARRKRRKPTPYPSDLTDAQWELIAPMVPAALPGGRPAIHDRRRIVEAILHVNRTGCSWRQLRMTSRLGRPFSGTSSDGTSPG